MDHWRILSWSLMGLLKEEKVRTSEKCCPDSRRGQEAAS